MFSYRVYEVTVLTQMQDEVFPEIWCLNIWGCFKCTNELPNPTTPN